MPGAGRKPRQAGFPAVPLSLCHRVRRMATDTARIRLARCRQNRVAFLALLLRLLSRSQSMHAMARGADCGFRRSMRYYKCGVLAGQIIFLFCRMAGSAECWNFIRSSHAVWRSSTGGRPMLHTLAVAGIAAQAFRKMRMGLEVANLLAMTRRA